jgi:hypothetical protein
MAKSQLKKIHNWWEISFGNGQICTVIGHNKDAALINFWSLRNNNKDWKRKDNDNLLVVTSVKRIQKKF